MLNSLTLLLVGLALSFLLGTFITKEDILTALVNVVTLGMSFLCGVFVPLDIMGKGVKPWLIFFRSTGMRSVTIC